MKKNKKQKELPTHTKSGRKIQYDEYGNDIDVMFVNENLSKLFLERARVSGKFNQLVDLMQEFYDSELK